MVILEENGDVVNETGEIFNNEGSDTGQLIYQVDNQYFEVLNDIKVINLTLLFAFMIYLIVFLLKGLFHVG